MNFLKLLLGGLITTAAYVGTRYWLTRGRAFDTPSTPGIDVPEGIAKAAGKEKH